MRKAIVAMLCVYSGLMICAAQAVENVDSDSAARPSQAPASPAPHEGPSTLKKGPGVGCCLHENLNDSKGRPIQKQKFETSRGAKAGPGSGGGGGK